MKMFLSRRSVVILAFCVIVPIAVVAGFCFGRNTESTNQHAAPVRDHNIDRLLGNYKIFDWTIGDNREYISGTDIIRWSVVSMRLHTDGIIYDIGYSDNLDNTWYESYQKNNLGLCRIHGSIEVGETIEEGQCELMYKQDCRPGDTWQTYSPLAGFSGSMLTYTCMDSDIIELDTKKIATTKISTSVPQIAFFDTKRTYWYNESLGLVQFCLRGKCYKMKG